MAINHIREGMFLKKKWQGLDRSWPLGEHALTHLRRKTVQGAQWAGEGGFGPARRKNCCNTLREPVFIQHGQARDMKGRGGGDEVTGSMAQILSNVAGADLENLLSHRGGWYTHQPYQSHTLYDVYSDYTSACFSWSHFPKTISSMRPWPALTLENLFFQAEHEG